MRSILAAIAYKNDHRILKRASELAREQSASLTILSVVEDHWLDSPEVSAMAEVQEARSQALSDVRTEMEELAISAGLSDGSFSVRVVAGRAPDVIVNVADEIAADLIAIGPGRRRTLREKVLGSTADRVVRSSPVPVLLVRDSPKGPYRHVIAALDRSESSEQVARMAAALNAVGRLELVHVTQVPLALEQTFLRSATVGGRLTEYKQALMEKARRHLCQIAQLLDAKREPRVRVLTGEPAAVLLRLSRRAGPNLIVASRHSKGPIERMFLGSVASRLLRHGRCDLLIAPLTEFKSA